MNTNSGLNPQDPSHELARFASNEVGWDATHDYEAALARINVLMDGDPEPTSAAGEELELLCLLVGNYEAVHYPME